MRALIMAAGVGSRISRHLQGQPKSCVDISGKALIRYTVELLQKKGFSEIAVVTGYEEAYIHQALEGLSYKKYFNPFYRITNSVASAWFSQAFLTGEDDIMIMNGDVFLEEKILDEILLEKRSPTVFADSSRIEDADYRFAWEDDKLLKYGKELTNEETTGEYVGLCILKSKDIEPFKENIINAIRTEDYTCWWEDVIYRTIDNGDKVYVNDISGTFWAEVDFIEDYNRIVNYLHPDPTNPKPQRQ